MNISTLTEPLAIPHPGQLHTLRTMNRFSVVVCGRRWGKTELGLQVIIHLALTNHRVWWLAPTYSMAGEVWRRVRHLLRDMPALQISESERRLSVCQGGEISIRSAHLPDNLRGAGLDFVVLDEAAFMLPSVWPQVVRPMLLERGGGALFISTPKGRNWFWNLYQRGLDPDEPLWSGYHFASSDNPLIDPAEFDEIRRRTPERIWREEYLAQFIDESGQVFRHVDAACVLPVTQTPQPGHRYCFGVDWGREHDYTAVAVYDSDEGAIVALDRFNRIGWQVQRDRLAALVQHWQPEVIWAESNSIGSVNIEALQRDGLPVRAFTTTQSSKMRLIETLALAFEQGTIRLIDDAVLRHELLNYQLERTANGSYRYSAPSGEHDDTVIATALAYQGARTASPQITFG